MRIYIHKHRVFPPLEGAMSTLQFYDVKLDLSIRCSSSDFVGFFFVLPSGQAEIRESS